MNRNILLLGVLLMSILLVGCAEKQDADLATEAVDANTDTSNNDGAVPSTQSDEVVDNLLVDESDDVSIGELI